MTGFSYIPLIIEKLKETKPEKIILFGSYAYGDPADDSDLDILVVTGDDIMPSNFAEKSMIYLRISKAISDIKKEFPVDLIVHTKPMHKRFVENDSLFARELMEKGKVLYEKSNSSYTSGNRKIIQSHNRRI
jgi:predicted nucleotidyltransferase